MPTIRVVVRFRPINGREKETAAQNNWSGKQICPLFVDEKHLLEYEKESDDDKIGQQVRCYRSNIQKSMQPKFAFDEILVWVSQQTAFTRIGLPVVLDALNGINGTIFAYGQTGSGKTFSMFGPEPLTESNSNLLGIIPRCCAQIFTNLAADEKVKHYRIDVSFFEIYIHNTIRDLLHPAKKGDPPLKVRDGPKGVFIEHLKSEQASNLTEILALISLANSHRTVSTTQMNKTSSRSHSVMRVSIRIERKDGSRVKSQINFGDLAGSEKVGKTGASGQTLREAQAINQSLTMLGNVISALAKIGAGKKKEGSMIPFRDCALTHVLKDSLAGNCKTTLVTAASPHKFNLVETISTFRFASRCKLVKTVAVKNQVLSSAQMRKLIESLRAEIKKLKLTIMKGGGGASQSVDGQSGIGVKITWPEDFQNFPTEKKVHSALVKQVNTQILDILKNAVADNSDDVDDMPYVVSLSDPGCKRRIIIAFQQDDDDGDDEESKYSREKCIELSKKLAEEINKLSKKSLVTALRNYKLCKHFSEASTAELKQVIEAQKAQILEIEEERNKFEEELAEKTNQMQVMEETMHNSDLSLRSSKDLMNGGSGHMVGYTEFSGASSTQMVNLFGKKTMLNRTSSIFDGGNNNGNSLRITDLLSQLLHSKYEVLRSKRSLQLLQVRYDSEQRRMAQLRYVISRMQSEFTDLKNMANGAKQFVLNNYVSSEKASNASHSRPLSMDNMNVSDRSRSQSHSFLDDDDADFLQDALGDIMADMDIDVNVANTPKSKKSNKLLRAFSSLKPKNKLKEPKTAYRRRSASGYRSKRQRRNSAGHIKRNNSKQSALSAYNFNRKTKPNNLLTAKTYLVKQSKSMRKELLNDMIFSTKKQNIDDDEEEELLKKRQQLINHQSDTYVPSVPFNDVNKLWRGYDKEWIKPWSIEDVVKWLKSIHDGKLRKFTSSFRKARIDGKRLLDLQMPNLLKLGMPREEAQKILDFTDSIAIDDDEDSDDGDIDFGFFGDFDNFGDDFMDGTDVDDFFEDEEDTKQSQSDWSASENALMSPRNNGGPRESINVNVLDKLDHRFYDDATMRLTDLMIEQLNKSEITNMRQLKLLNMPSVECINFTQLKEYYADEIKAKKQILLATIFGLLCNKVGLLNISEWNDLLHASKKYDGGSHKRKSEYFDDHMVIINSFVDVYGIYSANKDEKNNDCLSVNGAKYFIASLRQNAEEAKNLRDDEDGVSFFAGLRMNEMEIFVRRLPTTIWTLINNPLEIELVYRELKQKCTKNVTADVLQKCLVNDLCANLEKNAVEQSMNEMNLVQNPTVFLDIWIKKLFIKMDGDDDGAASVSILDEMLIINDELELQYYKEQRLKLLARNSGDSQAKLEDDASLNVDDTLRSLDMDNLKDSDEDIEAKEEEVAWVPKYTDLNKLLHDVGCFGTCGKCHGLSKIPSTQFLASSEANKKISNAKKCKLNGKYGWTANKSQSAHWIQVDLGKITTLFAVAVQGKYEKDEWITKGSLSVCKKENDEWIKVQLAGDHEGKIACSDSQTVQVYMLSKWIKTRFVRLNVLKYHNAPSLRWDLCFGDVKIPNMNI